MERRSGRVFRRSAEPEPPVAVEAHGSTILDGDGREYIDAAGGAVVVNVGHGRGEIADAMADQAARLAYAHGSAFTTEPVEAYARRLAPYLPVEGAAIYPVSGGSEAIESALKLVRAYHLARGEPERWIVFSRWGSYHGNSLGALDLSGRKPLRRPYEAWLGRFRHLSAAYPYRAGDPGANALATSDELAEELERAIESADPGAVAAFVAEPIVGATLGAAVPPEGYWQAIAEVCRREGVPLVADEVMTGFGRTGRWFGLDHWGVRADILVSAKGATSGYWPFGLVAASDDVWQTVTHAGDFVHGFTYSHHPVGAAVAGTVLDILERESLVDASEAKGRGLREGLEERIGGHPNVGEIRGAGLLLGIELVAERGTREPFPRQDRVIERVLTAARERGLLLYSGTGNANGVDGDVIVLGPPFVITAAEMEAVVDRLAGALDEVLGPGSEAPAAPRRAAGATGEQQHAERDEDDRPDHRVEVRQGGA